MMMNSCAGLTYGDWKLVTSNRTYARSTGVYIDGSNEVFADIR